MVLWFIIIFNHFDSCSLFVVVSIQSSLGAREPNRRVKVIERSLNDSLNDSLAKVAPLRVTRSRAVMAMAVVKAQIIRNCYLDELSFGFALNLKHET